MRKIIRTSLVLLGSAALVGGMALPASAVDVTSGENIATVEIEAGFLVLDTTTEGFTLTHSGASASDSSATGSLPGVTVSDLNGDGAGWTSTAVLSNLTIGELPAEVQTIDASAAVYTSVVTDFTGTVVTGLDNTVTAALESGNNTAEWTTSATINVPNTVKAGSYSGTLTHSLL